MESGTLAATLVVCVVALWEARRWYYKLSRPPDPEPREATRKDAA